MVFARVFFFMLLRGWFLMAPSAAGLAWTRWPEESTSAYRRPQRTMMETRPLGRRDVD